MTTDEALKEIQDHVQWCREEGETDLRGILHKIKFLREKIRGMETENVTSVTPTTKPPTETPTNPVWDALAQHGLIPPP